MTEIYLDIDKKVLDDSEKEAIAFAMASDPNDEYAQEGNRLLYDHMNLDEDNIEYEEGIIKVYGRLMQDGKDFGFIDIKIKPDADLVAAIIETYVKKLNKVKTMLEATK